MARRRDDYLTHLSRVPMFSTASKKDLGTIAKHTTEMRFAEGEELIREGQMGTQCFILASGRVKVSRNGRKIAELGPGEFFGELSLLDRAPRTATVTCLTYVDAFVLSEPEFDTVMAEVPSLRKSVMRGLAQRLREVDRALG